MECWGDRAQRPGERLPPATSTLDQLVSRVAGYCPEYCAGRAIQRRGAAAAILANPLAFRASPRAAGGVPSSEISYHGSRRPRAVRLRLALGGIVKGPSQSSHYNLLQRCPPPPLSPLKFSPTTRASAFILSSPIPDSKPKFTPFNNSKQCLQLAAPAAVLLPQIPPQIRLQMMSSTAPKEMQPTMQSLGR